MWAGKSAAVWAVGLAPVRAPMTVSVWAEEWESARELGLGVVMADWWGPAKERA